MLLLIVLIEINIGYEYQCSYALSEVIPLFQYTE